MDAKITGIRYKSEPQRGMTFYIAETDKGIVKGRSHIELQVNQHVRLDGDWQLSKFNGQREFLFRSIIPSLPVSSRARLNMPVRSQKALGNICRKKYGMKSVRNGRSPTYPGFPGLVARLVRHGRRP